LRPVSHSITTGSRRSTRQSRDDDLIIRSDRDAGFGQQGPKTRDLLVADQIVADEDVVDAGFSHHLGLAQFLAGDALCSDLDLELSEKRTFVRLDVGPVGDARGIADVLDPRDIALDTIHVDDERGRSVLTGDLCGKRTGQGGFLFL
jgi:hypothetical protein